MPYLPLLQFSISVPTSMEDNQFFISLQSKFPQWKTWKEWGQGVGSMGKSACCASMRIQHPCKKMGIATNTSASPVLDWAETVGSPGLAGCQSRWKISSSRFNERPCLRGIRQTAVREYSWLPLLSSMHAETHGATYMCIWTHSIKRSLLALPHCFLNS